MNDTSYDLMIQVCMKHNVSHILYGLSLFLITLVCLLCDNERSICLLQWTVFHTQKRCIVNTMII